MCKRFFLATLLIVSASLWAKDTAADFKAAKDFTRTLGNQPLNQMKAFNPQQVFEHYNNAPKEGAMYQGVEAEKTDLTASARAHLNDDKAGGQVYREFGENPRPKINLNNEAIKQGKAIEEDSYNLTHAENGKAVCRDKPAECKVIFRQERCEVLPVVETKHCQKTRHVTALNERISKETTFTLKINSSTYQQAFQQFNLNLTTGVISNQDGQPMPGSVTPTLAELKGCEQMTVTVGAIKDLDSDLPFVPVVVTALPTCANPVLTLNEQMHLGRALRLSLRLTITTVKPKVVQEVWQDNCEAVNSDVRCLATAERCLSAQATRLVNGAAITRDCWEKEIAYACRTNQAATCPALEARGCLQVASQCTSGEAPHCDTYEQRYQCPEQQCLPAVVCTKNIFCSDGSCSAADASQNTEFGQAVSTLAAAGGIGDEFKRGNARLFGGTVARCKISPLHFLDCCSNEGWGKKLNLAHCSDKDKALGQAKLNYTAHYLGKYCAKKLPKPLKGCKTWKNSYCLFDSKLARLIQEEGRLKQLNPASLGTPKNPTCTGLTVEEIQQIDFSRIDFVKPVYPYEGGVPDEAAGIASDLKPNLPEAQGAASVIRKRIEQRTGGQ